MTETKTTALQKRTGKNDVTVTSKMKGLFFGGAFGFIFGILLITLFAVIFAYTSVPDTVMDLFVYGTVGLSAFSSGFTALRVLKRDGMVNGLISGVILFLIHATVGSFFGEGGVTKLLLFGAAELPLAALGGILSVNMGLKKSRT